MSDQGKVELIIRRVSDQEIQSNIQNEKIARDENIEKLSLQSQAINTALINAGRQVIMTGVSQFGNITGDFETGRQIQTIISVASDVGTIAIGGYIGVIAVASKYALQGTQNIISQRKVDKELAYMVEKSGNANIRGSRWQING